MSDSPERRTRPGRYAFCAIVGLLVFAFARGVARGPDWECYYCHVVSLALDGDLAYENQMPLFPRERRFLSSEGRVLNNYSIGPTLFWAPFFAMGHASARSFGSGAMAGCSPHHFFWINVSSAVLAALTLLLAFRTAREFVSVRAAVIACVGICFGTPFFYYATHFSPSAHNTSMFLTAALLCLWARLHRDAAEADPTRWALLGLVGGLAVCQRTQNAAFLILCAYTLAHQRRRHLAACVASFVSCMLMGFLPQMVLSRYMTGNWLGVRSAHLRHHSWLSPNALKLLFSPYNGAFFWSPILIAATGGCLLLWQKRRVCGTLMVIVLAANVYLAGGHTGWSGGDAFGCRYLLNCTALFVVGLAVLLDRMRTRWRWALVAPCMLWTYALFLQSAGGDGAAYRTPAEILRGQWWAMSSLPRLMWTHLRVSWAVSGPGSPAAWVLVRIFAAAVVCAVVWACTRPVLKQKHAIAAAFGCVCLFTLWVFIAAVLRDQPVSQWTADRLTKSDVDLYDQAGVHFDLGAYRLRRGETREAASEFRQAITIYPGSPYAQEAREHLRRIERTSEDIP